MEAGPFSFTREELERLKGLYQASQKQGVNWVQAISAFPAETEEEKIWKERTLAGIGLVEAMISGRAQTGEQLGIVIPS
jgi:hypothetical protein